LIEGNDKIYKINKNVRFATLRSTVGICYTCEKFKIVIIDTYLINIQEVNKPGQKLLDPSEKI